MPITWNSFHVGSFFNNAIPSVLILFPQLFFFFLESIIVRLGVHNPMWHFYRLSRLYVLSLLINFDFTFNTSPRCWARLCDSEGVGRNGALVCAKGKWLDCDCDNI